MGALSKLEMKTRKHHLVKKETESDSSIQGAGRILSRKRKRKEIGALSRLERDIPGTLDQKKKNRAKFSRKTTYAKWVRLATELDPLVVGELQTVTHLPTLNKQQNQSIYNNQL
jgi:hypothetical protein